MNFELPHGAGCIGCDDGFVAGLMGRLRRDHASLISHVDDSALRLRVRAAVSRALARGIAARTAINQFVTLLFALEPDFERRFRVRERLSGASSLEEGILNLPSGSHPNCWYRADPAGVELAWQSLLSHEDSLKHPASTPSDRNDCDDIVPPQLSGHYGFQLDAPYVATPNEVVRQMLQLAQVGPLDTVMDLGSGDGRMVITAAQHFRARGIGVDINPENIENGRCAAERASVSNRVKFIRADLFDVDVSEATVVTLYLLRQVNLELRDRLRNELRPGARIVSRHFDMGDWNPSIQVGETSDRIYCWRIGSRPGA